MPQHRLTGLGQVSEILPKGVFKFQLIAGIPAFTLVDIPSVKSLLFQPSLPEASPATYSM